MSIRSELDQAKARIAELETENGTARGLVTLAGFDLDAHKLNVETLKATTGELIACEARAERAEAEAASLRAENEALRKQADITQKGYDHLHNHNRDLSQYAERYETELAEAKDTIKTLRKQLADAWEARDDYMRTNSDLRGLIVTLRKRVGKLEGEVSNRLAQAEAKIASGMSWGGFNLLGDGKSIDEAKRLLHEAERAEQLVVLIKDERARAEQAEKRVGELQEALDALRERQKLFEDGNRPVAYHRDTLGRYVREAWVRWARTQPNPKPSWLVGYDELPEPDKEADRQIGECVARWVLIGANARAALQQTSPSKPKEARAEIEALRKRVGELERQLGERETELEAVFARAEQAEAQLAEANASAKEWERVAEDQLVGLRKVTAELAEANERCRIYSLDNTLTLANEHFRLRVALAKANADLVTAQHALVTQHKLLAEAKSALSAMEADRDGYRTAYYRISIGRDLLHNQRDEAQVRIASLEKSVTVLRAENVELREIAGGLSYYADGHGLQEKWAAELRDLNQRLGALAQATDQPAPCRETGR